MSASFAQAAGRTKRLDGPGVSVWFTAVSGDSTTHVLATNWHDATTLAADALGIPWRDALAALELA